MKWMLLLLVACGSSAKPAPPPINDTCVSDSDCTLDYGHTCCYACGRSDPLGAITHSRDEAESRQADIDCKDKQCPEVDCAGPPPCLKEYAARCDKGACQAEVVKPCP